jgi:hypothetical protein
MGVWAYLVLQPLCQKKKKCIEIGIEIHATEVKYILGFKKKKKKKKSMIDSV